MATGRIELGPTGKITAANVKRLRTKQGMSLRALALRLKRSGRAISADALNKIENGAEPVDEDGKPRNIRRVDADDLVALAVALGVSPLALLLPPNARVPVEVTGAGEVDGREAWQWALCEQPLQLPDDAESADRAYTEFLLTSRPLGMFSSQGDDRIPGMIRERGATADA